MKQQVLPPGEGDHHEDSHGSVLNTKVGRRHQIHKGRVFRKGPVAGRVAKLDGLSRRID
jgi:hypothetical protein